VKNLCLHYQGPDAIGNVKLIPNRYREYSTPMTVQNGFRKVGFFSPVVTAFDPRGFY